MIELKITGRNYELNDKIREYIAKKLGSLDKFLPRGHKQARGDVILTLDPSGREGNQCVCEVVIRVDGHTMQSQEATLNMYAAIDIVEAKIKSQASKYKEKMAPTSRRRALIAKLLARSDDSPAPREE